MIEREYQFPPVRTPSIIIDAGANIGLASIFFALQYPNASIIAIEPEPGNFALLCHNVRQFASIRPMQVALWSEASQVRLVDPGRGSWGFRLESLPSQVPNTQSVSIESLMRELGFDEIDILKLDIEGAEKEVLACSQPWIRHVRSVVVELHDNFSPGASDAFRAATTDFERGWRHGENEFVARAGFVLD